MRLKVIGRAAALTSVQPLPLYLCSVKAGFPSPADDFLEARIDLNQQLVPHPSATYFLRVQGYSMKNAGIFPGDLLLVDVSIEPKDGMIVVAVIDGLLTLKRLSRKNGRCILMADNPDFPPIEIPDDSDFKVWGVVKNSIRFH